MRDGVGGVTERQRMEDQKGVGWRRNRERQCGEVGDRKGTEEKGQSTERIRETEREQGIGQGQQGGEKERG